MAKTLTEKQIKARNNFKKIADKWLNKLDLEYQPENNAVLLSFRAHLVDLMEEEKKYLIAALEIKDIKRKQSAIDLFTKITHIEHLMSELITGWEFSDKALGKARFENRSLKKIIIRQEAQINELKEWTK